MSAIVSLTMPKLGLTMTEAILQAWLVDVGDLVCAGDEFAEVETEKATQAIESQWDGVLRRRIAREGDVVSVGGVLGIVAPADISDEAVDAFIAALPSADATPSDDTATHPQYRTVAGPTGKLNVLEQGDGSPVVVLLHGFGGDALNWRYLVDGLAAARRVLALDLPGHGASTKDVRSAQTVEFVDSVLAVCRELTDGPVHLVGHSFGGLVAAEVALDHPDVVASLTLIAPVGLGAEIDTEFLDGFVAAASRREVKESLSHLYADPSIISRELVEQVLKYKRLEGVPEALAAIRDVTLADGRRTDDLSTRLAALQVPLLVIWGAADAVLPSSHAQNAPPNASVTILDGVGHTPHVEAPSATLTAIDEFLRQ